MFDHHFSWLRSRKIPCFCHRCSSNCLHLCPLRQRGRWWSRWTLSNPGSETESHPTAQHGNIFEVFADHCIIIYNVFFSVFKQEKPRKAKYIDLSYMCIYIYRIPVYYGLYCWIYMIYPHTYPILSPLHPHKISILLGKWPVRSTPSPARWAHTVGTAQRSQESPSRAAGAKFHRDKNAGA